MAISTKMYSSFPFMLIRATFANLSAANTLKVMLCTSAYTPDQNYHTFKSDVTNEVSGTGYTAGGEILTGVNAILTLRKTYLEADNVTWPESTMTARYAVLYDYTGATDDVRRLIAYIDFGEDKSSEDGTFQLMWNAGGIFEIIVAA